jgi:hypothetical protein
MSNEDFANCYMPQSEIVIIAKKHSVNNEIIFSLESEPYETKDNNNEESLKMLVLWC